MPVYLRAMLARFFRHDSCSKRLDKLEDELRRLQRQLADAEDYITRLSGRVLKRIDRAERAEEPSQPAREAPAEKAARSTLLAMAKARRA